MFGGDDPKLAVTALRELNQLVDRLGQEFNRVNHSNEGFNWHDQAFLLALGDLESAASRPIGCRFRVAGSGLLVPPENAGAARVFRELQENSQAALAALERDGRTRSKVWDWLRDLWRVSEWLRDVADEIEDEFCQNWLAERGRERIERIRTDCAPTAASDEAIAVSPPAVAQQEPCRNDRDQLTGKARKALEYIIQNPGALGKNVAKAINVTPESFRSRYVPRLKEHGVVNEGDGYRVV